jgi:NADH-ubiquinone oxidoreductase chain 3
MINLVTTYQEKYSIFECGYHSFLGQNRTQFGVKFFIFALVYLILDLEILLTFPYAASGYENDIYGLTLTLGFIVIITLGFVFELGKQALRIDSKQTSSFNTRPSGHLAAQASASLNNKISNPSFLRKGSISPACVTKLTRGIRRFSSSNSTQNEGDPDGSEEERPNESDGSEEEIPNESDGSEEEIPNESDLESDADDSDSGVDTNKPDPVGDVVRQVDRLMGGTGDLR